MQRPAVSTSTAAGRLWTSPQAPFVAALLAAVMLVTGLAFRWVASQDTDVPPLSDLCRRLAEGSPSLQHHAFGDALWKRLWRTPGGQIDERLLLVASAPLQVLALMGLAGVLAAGWRRWTAVAFLASVAGLLVLSPLSPVPRGEGAGWALCLIFSTLHLVLETATPRARGRVCLSALAGLAAVVTATVGLAAPLAACLFHVWRQSGPSTRERSPAGAAVAAILGLALVLWRAAAPSGSAGAATDWAWSASLAAFGLLLWFPSLCWLWRAVRGGLAAGAEPRRTLFALWAVLLAAVAAATKTGAVPEVLLAAVLINAVCVLRLVAQSGALRAFVLGALWCIVVVDAFLHPSADLVWERAGPRPDTPTHLRLAEIAQGRSGTQESALSALPPEVQACVQRLADRSALPPSLSAPLMTGIDPEKSAGFRADCAPGLKGHNALPVYGTWNSASPGIATGRFVGQSMTAQAPFLQLRIAGTVQEPATAVRFLLADGREIPAGVPAMRSEGRWKRVTLDAPAGPFRLVVQDDSPTDWIAVTLPQQVPLSSLVAGKVAKSWFVWTLGGLVLGALALWQAARASDAGEVAPTGPRTARARVAVWLGVGAYLLFCAHHLDTTCGPNDSGGYLNQARALAERQLAGKPRLLPPEIGGTDIEAFVPVAFYPLPDGRMAPMYPIGLPLIIGAVAQLMPLLWAVPVVTLLHLLGGIVLMRMLGREMGLPDGWAWFAAGLVALSPVTLFQGLQPLSDHPSMVWAMLTVYAAWISRRHPWCAVLAGLATAIAVLMRPSNVVVALPAFLCLAGSWRQLLLWIGSGLPGAVFLLWFHQTMYGSPFATGYGNIDGYFLPKYVWPTLKAYAALLPVLFTPVVVLGLAGPVLRAIPGRIRLVLGAWAGGFLGLYAFYFCTHENWYNMRFIMPGMPALVLLAVLVLRHLCDRRGVRLFSDGASARDQFVSWGLALGLAAFLILDGAMRETLTWVGLNRDHADSARWAGENTPGDAVIIAQHASGPLSYYATQPIVRADHPLAKSRDFYERVRRAGREIYAVTNHWETANYILEEGRELGSGYPNLPGKWQERHRVNGGTVYVYQWIGFED